jgi:hypothetical protein
MENLSYSEPKIVTGDAGYVLEDVPHFTDYIPDLPVTLSLSLSLSESFWLLRKTERKKRRRKFYDVETRFML